MTKELTAVFPIRVPASLLQQYEAAAIPRQTTRSALAKTALEAFVSGVTTTGSAEWVNDLQRQLRAADEVIRRQASEADELRLALAASSALIADLECRVVPDKVKPSRKAKREFVALNEHQAARIQVLRCLFRKLDNWGATSSELARDCYQTTNNISKRLEELRHEGYVERLTDRDGPHRRMSLDSNKMLDVWVRTGKPLPFYVEGI